MSCPEQDLIDRKALGTLTEEETRALQAHVASCPECEARLREATYLETLLVGCFRETAEGLESPKASILARLVEDRPSRRVKPEGDEVVLRRRLRWGFVLVVTHIAAVFLIAVAFAMYHAAFAYKHRALVARARTEVQSLAQRLVDYGKVNAFPGDGIENLVKALSEPKPEGDRRWAFFDPQSLAGDAYLDPWGHPYRYHSPHGLGSGDVFVYSIGENGVDEGGRGDDVSARLKAAG